MEGMRKAMKITQDSRSSGRNLNLVNQKYEAEVLNSSGDAMWQVESCMGCNIANSSRRPNPHSLSFKNFETACKLR
jgi:hypothetical protein